jgi:RNA polymerase sigma factor (sigma-70 family)
VNAEEIIVKYRHIPDATIRRMNVPTRFREECWADCWEALVRCAQRFDAARGCSFLTFALHRIRGAAMDSMRRQSQQEEMKTRERALCLHSTEESTTENQVLLNEVLSALSTEDRQLLESYYLEGRFLHELDDFGKSWCSRRVRRALQRASEVAQ